MSNTIQLDWNQNEKIFQHNSFENVKMAAILSKLRGVKGGPDVSVTGKWLSRDLLFMHLDYSSPNVIDSSKPRSSSTFCLIINGTCYGTSADTPLLLKSLQLMARDFIS